MSYPRRNPPPQGPGLAPLEDGLIVPALADHLATRRAAKGDRPTADETRCRGSWAYNCSRRIGFELLGVPPDYALDGDTLAAFEVGQSWHDVLQEAGASTLGWECEVDASYRPDLSLSLHLDAVEVLPAPWGGKAAVEIKSKRSFATGIATGTQVRKPYGEARPGPEPADLVQGGMGAMAPNVGAEFVHYICCDKESGEIHEWVVHLDEPLAHVDGVTLRELVDAELGRFERLMAQVDNGELPERFVPGFGIVEHPPEHGATKRGDPWQCRYCAFNATCRGLATEAIPIPVSFRAGAA